MIQRNDINKIKESSSAKKDKELFLFIENFSRKKSCIPKL